MRLLSLRLAAIGPFPGEHHVDLESLGAGGLFLLEGPTGSGKSTLIDAIVFALYGRPAGLEASADRLPSKHAAPGARPEVGLVFETAAGLFRVQRSPEHVRPKRRGAGVTTEQARVLLWRLSDPADDAGTILSTRVGEADAEIRRIVGLTREQFVQTVVLPQGEFAAFLRATPEERRAVLQRIFGTEVYQRVQDRLVDAARAARRQAESTRAAACAAVDGFVTAVQAALRDDAPGLGMRATTDAEPDGAIVVDLLDHLVTTAAEPDEDKARALVEDVTNTLAHRAADLERTEDWARTEAAVAATLRDEAQATSDLVARRDRLRTEHASLAARSAHVEALERRLDAGRRASLVASGLRAADAARRAADDARRALDAELARVRMGADGDLAELDGPALAAARCSALRACGALDSLLAVEQALPARAAAADEARAALSAAQRRRAHAEAALAARPARRSALDVALGDLRVRAGRVEAGTLEVETARTVLGAAQAAERLAPRVAQEQLAVTVASATASAALAREVDLRRRRLAGMAGELAAALAPGVPCPVCGSADHPAPATRADAAVTDAEVSDAEDGRNAAERDLQRAARTCAETSARLDGELAAAGGLTADLAEESLRAREAALAEAREAAAQLPESEQRLAAFDATTEAAKAELARQTADEAAAGERLGAVTTALEADAAAVSEARQGFPTVADRTVALAARADAAGRLAETRQEAAATAAAHDEQRGLLAHALTEAGFADAIEAREAALDDATATRLESDVTAHRAAVARVAGGLGEPAVIAVGDDSAPDMEAITGRHERAAAAHLAAAREAERMRTQLAAVQAHGRVLADALAQAGAAVGAAQPATRMAELAAAGPANERRVTLAAYVLLRRFEDVVAAANARLAGMSEGRYALARTDEREGGTGAVKTGLGLVVEDHLTGDRRNPRTLSGGETFYVSLCLALGLADVVTSESGGIELGTLLIDEGFGSLDPDTLDDVLAELSRLRSGGRVVGIVSHVAELKQRIPERIEVRRRPDGSSTLAVTA